MLTFDRTYTELLLAPIPTFVGLVMMIIAITNIVVLSSRRGETGIQTGMAEMFQDLGASIGPVVVARADGRGRDQHRIVVGRLSTPNSNTDRPSPTIGVSTRIVIPTNPMNRLVPTRSAPT